MLTKIKEEQKIEIQKMGYKILEENRESGYYHWNLIIENKDGFKYNVDLYNILRSHHPKVVNPKNKYSLYNISLWLKLNNKDFELCDDNVYVNDRKKLKLYHSYCDDYFYANWAEIRRGGNCSVCRGMQTGEKHSLAYLRPDLIEEWSSRNKLSPEDVTIGCNKKVEWACKICGHVWPAFIYNRTCGKTNCPKCDLSKGEKEIEKFLNNNRIIYNFEHKFDDCKNINVLFFDFYLPNLNICIEYQGIQHYENKEFFGGKKFLKIQKRNDKIKVYYCRNNNIKLIIIPYWEFDNIENILKKEL